MAATWALIGLVTTGLVAFMVDARSGRRHLGDQLELRVDRSIADLRTVMDARFDSVDQRFDSVDQRFDSVDQRFDSVDQRFDSVDRRLDTMEQRIHTLNGDVRDIKGQVAVVRQQSHTHPAA